MRANTLTTAILLLLLSTAATANEEDIPDIDFLAFLGSFETADGKWLDPMTIDKTLDEENLSMLDETPQNEANENE